MSEQETSPPLMKEAKEQFEKVSKGWPEGELTQSAYGIATEIPCQTYIQYMFQPTEQDAPAEGEQAGFQLPFVSRI